MIIYKGKFSRRAYRNNAVGVLQWINVILMFINLVFIIEKSIGIPPRVILLVLLLINLILTIIFVNTHIKECVFYLQNERLIITTGENEINNIQLPSRHKLVITNEPESWSATRIVKRLYLFDMFVNRYISISQDAVSSDGLPVNNDRRPSDYLSLDACAVDVIYQKLNEQGMLLEEKK